MKKILTLGLILFSIGTTQSTLANASGCPSAQFIQKLNFVNADPHDYDTVWDAETTNFTFEGHNWDVAVQNFKPEQQSEQGALKTAQHLLKTSTLIQNPKKIRSPDNANNICIYVWHGSYGKDLLIVAYEY